MKGFRSTYPCEERRIELNKKLVDTIILLAQAVNDEDKKEKCLRPKYDYLLGQAIRDYLIPEANWHVSEKAAKTWKALTNVDLKFENFQEARKFKKSNDEGIQRERETLIGIDILDKLKNNTKFKFNDFFIAEHTIPVSDITNKLNDIIKNDQIKDKQEAVKSVLDKMHITRLLKSEDANIIVQDNRIEDYKKINSDFNFDEATSEEVFEKFKTHYYKDITIAN